MQMPSRTKRPILSTRGASKYSGPSPSKLEKLRVSGGGPKYIKIGRRVYYDPDDLDEWLAAQKRLSTSTAPMVEDRVQPNRVSDDPNHDQILEQGLSSLRSEVLATRHSTVGSRKRAPEKLARSDRHPNVKEQTGSTCTKVLPQKTEQSFHQE
jgi:predicted DNA-binding transcriptional regulator AlpA